MKNEIRVKTDSNGNNEVIPVKVYESLPQGYEERVKTNSNGNNEVIPVVLVEGTVDKAPLKKITLENPLDITTDTTILETEIKTAKYLILANLTFQGTNEEVLLKLYQGTGTTETLVGEVTIDTGSGHIASYSSNLLSLDTSNGNMIRISGTGNSELTEAVFNLIPMVNEMIEEVV